MIETPLRGQCADFVVSTPEVTNKNAFKYFAEHPFYYRGAAAFIDHKIAILVRGKTPKPFSSNRKRRSRAAYSLSLPLG